VRIGPLPVEIDDKHQVKLTTPKNLFLSFNNFAQKLISANPKRKPDLYRIRLLSEACRSGISDSQNQTITAKTREITEIK
jgi:hypothetical protein